MNSYHEAVMLREAMEGLQLKPDGIYVDATYGGGGHARAILNSLTTGSLVAFDQDAEARANVPAGDKLIFVNHNFRYMKNFLRYHGLLPVDGILADLGVSSHQFDEASRGFSTRFDGPLDMRMNKEGQSTASNVLNQYDAASLGRLFKLYGELRQSRKLAEHILRHREKETIATTGQLREIIAPLAPRGKENQFLARVFQSLRIEVNRELEALEELLEQSPEVLREGGRLVVISYHSLEDRMVKNFIRTGNVEGRQVKDFYGSVIKSMEAVSRHQSPGKEELERNPRARSARLRVAEKKPLQDD